MKMNDKNGIEMKTGDIVRIKDAYFKNDNGVYFIDHTPGDASWCGSDYSLRKMCNNGKLSIAKGNVAFWPLCAYTNNRLKNAECREWNKEHATIEVIYNIDNTQVIEHFKEEADRMKQQTERNSMYYGDDCQTTITSKEIYDLYMEIVARMETREEIEEPEAEPETVAELVEEVQEIVQEEVQEVVQESQPEVIEITRKYFPINERLARDSKSMWSFSDYATNSETQAYKKEVDKAYNIVDKIAERRPERIGDALYMAEKFSMKYATWINKGLSIEMQCPSVMICGGSNFPTRKKEKQNASRDRHMQELKYINGYIEKIENILYGKEIIKSGDTNAIEKLQAKLKELEEYQKFMKDLNNYYRKNNTCKGFQDFTEEKAQKLDASISQDWRNIPFPSYHLTNNNAKIKATKDRIESLQKAKATPTQESETIQSSVCRVVENTELMRIQLIFDGKPDEETRSILKSNGFKWAPSQKTWQRQLTSNAKYSTKKVIEQLEKLTS